MSNLNTERSTIATALVTAGVVASLDPSAAVPTVLVGSPSVLGAEGVGGWTVDFPIQIMAAPPGNAEALEWMLDQVEKVLTVFPGPAFPRTIEHLGKDVPAYLATVTRSVNNPNC